MLGDIANSATDLKHAISTIIADCIGQPSVVSRRVREPSQHLAAIFVLNVYVIGCSEPQNCPECAEAIFPIDLFAFFVSPARVTNRYFVNSGATLGKFNGQFRLYPEISRF